MLMMKEFMNILLNGARFALVLFMPLILWISRKYAMAELSLDSLLCGLTLSSTIINHVMLLRGKLRERRLFLREAISSGIH